jgi:hypothetical protein
MAPVDPVTVINAAAAAAIYSLLWFARNRAKNPEEAFMPSKFLSTVVVGVFIGVAMSVQGMSVTQENVEVQLAMMAGAVTLVEAVFKTVLDSARRRA